MFIHGLDCTLFWCRLSFATDVARGMLYLHQHKLFHGRLHSRNCVIDDRWVCKISGSNSPTSDVSAACQWTSVAPINLLARLGLPHYLPLEITRWKSTSGDPVAHSLTFGFRLWAGILPKGGLWRWQSRLQLWRHKSCLYCARSYAGKQLQHDAGSRCLQV